MANGEALAEVQHVMLSTITFYEKCCMICSITHNATGLQDFHFPWEGSMVNWMADLTSYVKFKGSSYFGSMLSSYWLYVSKYMSNLTLLLPKQDIEQWSQISTDLRQAGKLVLPYCTFILLLLQLEMTALNIRNGHMSHFQTKVESRLSMYTVFEVTMYNTWWMCNMYNIQMLYTGGEDLSGYCWLGQ